MQLPFSENNISRAHAVRLMQPTPNQGRNKTTAAAYQLSLPGTDHNTDLDQSASPDVDQRPRSELNKAEPLTVVKQTISALEEQGLLMLFDRHDRVAKRLTGDLMAAGVLHDTDLSESEQE